MSTSSSAQHSSLSFRSRAAVLATAGLASLTLVSTAAAAGSPSITSTSAFKVATASYQLNGEVNPNGSSTTTVFRYGTTTSYTNSVTAQSVAPNADPTRTSSVNAVAGPSLTPGAIYHYRLEATNAYGTAISVDKTFQATAKPIAIAKPNPIRLSDGSYQLNGEVNPGGLSTTTKFTYGATDTGFISPSGPTLNPAQQPGSMQTIIRTSTNPLVLTPGKVYTYRVEATNSLGTTVSADQTFTAKAKPVVTTGAAPVRLSDGSYRLSGKVNPAGLSTSVTIEYGEPGSHTFYPSAGTLSPTVTPGVAQSVSVGTKVTPLTPGTTYNYRTVATNSIGTTYGPTLSFTAS